MTEYAKRLRPGSRVYDVSNPAVPLVVVRRIKTEFYAPLVISDAIYTNKKPRFKLYRSPPYGPSAVYVVRGPGGWTYDRAAWCLRRIT